MNKLYVSLLLFSCALNAMERNNTNNQHKRPAENTPETEEVRPIKLRKAVKPQTTAYIETLLERSQEQKTGKISYKINNDQRFLVDCHVQECLLLELRLRFANKSCPIIFNQNVNVKGDK